MNIELDTEFLAHRSGQEFLYSMAHTVFGGEPDESLVAALRSSECVDVLRGMQKDCPECGLLADWCEALPAVDVSSSEELQTMKSEFNRAVAGLGAARKSHPWESSYTNNKQLLFQKETLEVRDFYRSFGCIPKMYPKVADDHISLECAFLASLAKQVSAVSDEESLKRLLDGQRDFLSRHLLKWLPLYSEELREDAADGLYDLAARSLCAFAKMDLEFLDDRLGC